MAAFADLELVPLLLWCVAFALASFALILAEAVSKGVSFLPVIGTVARDAIEGAIVNPLKRVVDDSEAGIAKGFEALTHALGVLGGLTILGIAGTVAGFSYLWHKGIPDLLSAAVGGLNTALSTVRGIAKGAAGDASKALSQIAALPKWTANEIVSLVAPAIAAAVDAGVSRAESYADTAVGKLKAAEDAAVATAVQLATTAEHDATQAYNDATTYVDNLVKPLAGDLSDFEQYVKGLGLPGAIAGVTALSAVVTAVLAETGLENAACRSKVKGICGTDPLAWAGLLAGIAAIGVAFDFKEFVSLLQELEKPVEALVRQAA